MKYIRFLSEISQKDKELVGGKASSLGELMTNVLPGDIPNGFSITTLAYDKFIKTNGFGPKIEKHLKAIRLEMANGKPSMARIRRSGLAIRTMIVNGRFSSSIREEIEKAYRILSSGYTEVNGDRQEATDVAVRSSATAEDTATASFAGQQETFLNVRGASQLLEATKKCFASLYTDRAISYRADVRYVGSLSLSVFVQKMVRSDLGSAGVAFSVDPDTGHPSFVTIQGTFGLGELLVSGGVTPDEFLVFSPSLTDTTLNPLIDSTLGTKTHRLVYGNTAQPTTLVALPKEMEVSFCLELPQVISLAKAVCAIRDYYGYDVDVEWGLDGQTGHLYIVQARPETVHSTKSSSEVETFHLKTDQQPLVTGAAIGNTVAQGKVHIMESLDGRYGSTTDGEDFPDGCILVTESTNPDWEPLMKRASAIVTDKGGRCCHSAIVARELGIPALVGCETARRALKDGQEVTVSCCEGETGFVYEGNLPFSKTMLSWEGIDDRTSRVPLLLNVGSPSSALSASLLPSSGIGLAREEFIINHFIGAHPLALLHPDRCSPEVQADLIEKIRGYASGADFFVRRLAAGIGRLGAAFYPRPVIVRFSDFKSNEYRNLLGGYAFEPEEENPMIGWRGASRYYSEAYEEAFGLECRAISLVRTTMGLTNVIVMVPFCRTPEEMRRVLATMAKYGLERGKDGLEVYLMCEVPSNVILAEEFCSLVDGFSIGSNDLTQLTLGLDRDSELVSHIYDERSKAVKTMLSMVIQTAKRCGTKIGICGQGPSDFPDFAEFLRGEGIDTISVTPDSLYQTIQVLK